MPGKPSIQTGKAPRVRMQPLSGVQSDRFLHALTETCSVREAAGVARITTAAAYRWRRRTPAFAAAWQDALAAAYERLETALLRWSLDRIDAAAAGGPAPGGGDAAERDARPLSAEDLRVAIALLARQRGAKAPVRATPRGTATAAQTDAALKRRLDALARRLGDPA